LISATNTNTLDYETPPRDADTTDLGVRTAHGMLWLVGQTLGSKAVSMVGQIMLAWFLAPADFGLIALAYTVSAFANLFQQAGLKEILVQRQKHFARWANAAFWMSLALSGAAALVMASTAPLAAHAYHAPGLTGLVWVLALCAPANALSVVPTARLQIQLRFRAQAMLAFLVNFGSIALSVLLAWAKFGAYSFVVPRLVMALVQAAASWWLVAEVGRGASRYPVRARLHLRRWRYLVGDSSLLMGAAVCYTIFSVGDYTALGLTHEEGIVGLYYFAFNLSTQAVVLLTVNLWGVLMPALSKLQHDPDRQLRGFLAATRLMALISVPCGLLQAALSEPGIRIFFAAKWYPAIPVLQALSIGMTFMMIGAPAGTLLQAQGRFKTLFYVAAGSAVGFMALVSAAALLGAALSMGVAVAVFYAAYGAASLYATVRPAGGSWREVLRVYGPALSAGIVAIGAAYGLSWLIPATEKTGWVARAAVTALVAAPAYLLLVPRLAPQDWRELMVRVRSMLPPRRHHGSTAPM
jgi:PST family polysaccharide transporter